MSGGSEEEVGDRDKECAEGDSGEPARNSTNRGTGSNVKDGVNYWYDKGELDGLVLFGPFLLLLGEVMIGDCGDDCEEEEWQV